MKVPTAKEFLESKRIYPHTKAEWECESVYAVMIEFAKLHVKAAVETCIEEAPSGSSTDTVSYEDVVEVLRDCYPENLIK